MIHDVNSQFFPKYFGIGGPKILIIGKKCSLEKGRRKRFRMASFPFNKR